MIANTTPNATMTSGIWASGVRPPIQMKKLLSETPMEVGTASGSANW